MSTIAVIAAAFAAGWLYAGMERGSVMNDLADRNEQTIATLKDFLREALPAEKIPVIRSVVDQAIQGDPAISSIELRNREGDVLLERQRSARPDGHDWIRFRNDLQFEGERFGSIEIAWDPDLVPADMEERMTRIWTAIALFLFALVFLVMTVAYWLAIRPLDRICRRLRSLAAGDLETPLKPEGSRELRLLAETVNEIIGLMREQLQQKEALNLACEDAFQAKELAEVTLHSIGDAVITTDREGKINYLNQVAEKLTAWSQEEAMGRPINEVFCMVDEKTGGLITKNPVSRALATGEMAILEENTKLIARDGRQFAIENSAAPIRSRDGQVLGVVLVFHDVTEQRRMAEKIQYQATHDPLTGLFNRHAFEQKLQNLLGGIDQGEHVLMYLDLDQFKVVNDTCGHAAGDALLVQLSEVMRQHTRNSDLVARLGGDEFAILLSHCPAEQAVRCAENVRSAIQRFRFFWNGNYFSIGASIGLVPFHSAKQTIQDIMSAADQACFAAKDAGRNRVHVYQPDDQELALRRQEMDWVAKIHRALEKDAFELYCQPILPVDGGKQEGFHYEILLRMCMDNGETVPPGAFMPAAERYDLMGLIDRWVISHYFRWLAEHPQHLEGLFLAGVNISGVSVSDRHFLDFVIKQFEQSAIPPDKICFEITETAAIANIVNANIMIEVLRKLGCSFALDDFGSGMSSFGYLKNMPVEYLKIDGTFVRDICHDPINRALVKSINDVGHIMNKQTIAEFVEDDEIFNLLKDIGIDYAQGYGIGRPHPLTGLVANGACCAYNCQDSVCR